jgi:signal transduction histidine kinase
MTTEPVRSRVDGPADTGEDESSLGVRVAGVAALAVAIGWLWLLDARSLGRDLSASVVTIGLDLAVGTAFIIGAVLAPGARRERALFALTGVAWLTAAYLPGIPMAYLGVMAVALVLFPTGRLRSGLELVFVVAAASLAVLPLPTLVDAGVLAAIGLRAVLARDRLPAWWFPAAGGLGLGIALGCAWLAGQSAASFDPLFWRTIDQLALLAVALGAPLALHAVAGRPRRLTDDVLADDRVTGVERLAMVLRDTLRDPSLRVVQWDAAVASYVDPGGQVLSPGVGGSWLPVDGPGGPIGGVTAGSSDLLDPAMSAAIGRAVRLVIERGRAQRALEAQLAELEAARTRLVDAGDRQRASMADRLRDEVSEPLRQSAAALQTFTGGAAVTDSEAAGALALATSELSAAADEVLDLVHALPAGRLGGGRLVHAVREIARRSAVPVRVTGTDVAGSAESEAALFYVCSEAVANAVKHAHAGRIDIELLTDGTTITARIADDGVGGADLEGSGLQGLADRVAASGGRLRVASPPGAGTLLVAEVPG